MTLRRFVWRNALRNKRRTGLTVLSMGFSLFLLMTLLTFMDELLNPVSNAEGAMRLLVAPATSMAEMLPYAYLEKIKRVPHVTHVSPIQWFGGIYKDPDDQFANFAVDPFTMFQVYSEQKIDPEQLAAFQEIRTAAVASENLAKRFNWKVGDRIPLTGTIFPTDLDLTLVGIFTDPLSQDSLYFRYDYFNELMDNFNIIGTFSVRASDPGSVPGVAVAIDNLFRNSASETKTETEKAFILGFISMLGNIRGIIASVAGVVVFTMLLVSVSTMAMSVRERIREVAILKTIGFPRGTILAVVIGEAVFMSLLGVGTGIAMGEWLRLVDLNRMTQGFIAFYNPVLTSYATVVATGLAIGLISGFFPAWQAVNMTVTAAMRRLD